MRSRRREKNEGGTARRTSSWIEAIFSNGWCRSFPRPARTRSATTGYAQLRILYLHPRRGASARRGRRAAWPGRIEPAAHSEHNACFALCDGNSHLGGTRRTHGRRDTGRPGHTQDQVRQDASRAAPSLSTERARTLSAPPPCNGWQRRSRLREPQRDAPLLRCLSQGVARSTQSG